MADAEPENQRMPLTEHLSDDELYRGLEADISSSFRRVAVDIDKLLIGLQGALKENEKDKRQIQIWLEQYAELATENKELRQRIAELEKG